MRYWGFLIGKLSAAAAVSWVLFRAIVRWWPDQMYFNYPLQKYVTHPARFGFDLYFTLALGGWFLLTCGLAYLCVWEQRYRCRVCLRRLRMPVETGSWSRMLQLGRPEIEYICPYGHGRLNVAEVQISGPENPEWTPGADMWEELAAGRPKGDRDE
ncbi:MAG: hypothetical protein ACRD96_01055 [Bryobacteraceae bacterium]